MFHVKLYLPEPSYVFVLIGLLNSREGRGDDEGFESGMSKPGMLRRAPR